jgi:hypothetical protein
MGERPSMNREGVAGAERAEPVRIRYQSLARPDRRVYRPVTGPVRRRMGVVPYVAPDYPTWDYLVDLPDPEPAPILPPPPRRTPGPLRFGSVRPDRPAPTAQPVPELPPLPPSRRRGRTASLYVLRVRYADGGTDWFTYTQRERAERFAAREMVLGSAVQLREV